MITLQELVDRLGNLVPVRGDVPTVAQYEQAVKDAVADFSRRCPLQMTATLSIVPGTATYALPADFLRLIRLQSVGVPGGIAITNEGIIPMGAGATREQFTIAGQQIKFIPTPQYTATRTLWYGAAHVLEDGSYTYLMEEEAAIVLLQAQGTVLRLQGVAAISAGEISEYQIGDERVKRTSPGQGLMAQAEAMEKRYLEAVRSRVGQYGTRGGR